MNEVKSFFEKYKSNGFKLWISNIKSNWLSNVVNLILYLIPFIVIKPKISEYIVSKFNYVVIFLTVIFLINEFLKTNELIKNDNELRSIKENNKQLEKIRSELEGYSESIGLFLENLPKEFLRNVSEFLDLKNSERISLYVLDGEKFRIIGRYSENPKYDMIGRGEYPSDCGYISKCLENDNGNVYFIREKLPQNDNNYLKVVSKDTGMHEDDINKLSMKSRAYFTRVIKDRYNKNVGILVIESTKSRLPLDAEVLNNKLEELSIPHMSTFLDVSNKLKGGCSDE